MPAFHRLSKSVNSEYNFFSDYLIITTNTSQKAREINTEQFEMLLAGIDFWRAHEEIKFDAVF